jgi:hypothetical protein
MKRLLSMYLWEDLNYIGQWHHHYNEECENQWSAWILCKKQAVKFQLSEKKTAQLSDTDYLIWQASSWLLDSRIKLYCGASSYIPRFQSFTNDFTVAIFDHSGNRNGATEWCGVSQSIILSRGCSNQIKQKHINQPHWKTLCPGQGMGNQQGNTPESPSLH